MTSGGDSNEKVLWGKNQKLPFRYFKLDMPLETVKREWQEVSWAGGSEGQGLS